MPDVVVYATATCPYCVAARNFLTGRGYAFRELRVDREPTLRAEMEARARRTSVPQIFIGDRHVGGYDDLMALDRGGGLRPLLEGGQ